MTKKLLLSVSVAIMLAACQGAGDAANKAKDTASKITLPAGVTLLETVTKKGDEVVTVSYTHLTLPTTPYV